MTTTHTPGVWFGPVNHAAKFEIQGDGKKIAVVETVSDAARIVRCVNAHDDLLAALQKIADCRNIGSAHIIARAAIAKATGAAP